ncbi:hypothetical protein JOD82_001825 [Paenibacillus sp. 1182]|uniref:hypothetical protein n=1 Tax=Paenibacillus sp. 1182 TaxID=2806565 RepID=UPI001AE68E13|nr:hypothetical protein [Paenibacillus sp. 1182]MBP1308805.1 hypothetical protein [Paenibacillus sp. 1182]
MGKMWNPFRKKTNPVKVDEVNRGYVCLSLDPENTINDLSVGDWNAKKLQDSLASGMLRYPMQSEVDAAITAGKIIGKRTED